MKWPAINLIEGEKPWVTYAKRQTTIQNNCINLICTGGPGKGKSWALLSYFCLIDPDFDLEKQCFFVAKDLIRAFQGDKIVKNKPFLYDEAGIDANSLKWQDEVNRGLNAFFQTARHKNYIFGMTVPFTSLVSKGVRTLMNCHFRAEGWTSNNLTKVRPLVLEWNDDLNKFYRKRLLVKSENGIEFCNQMRLPKPPPKIVYAYEKRKKEFTTNLYDDIVNKIDKKEKKEQDKSMVELTYKQEKILERLKDGLSVKEIAAQDQTTTINISQTLRALRKKGFKIQAIKETKTQNYSYKVDNRGLVY